MRLWLELGSALVALAFVWAVIETYFLGRTAPPSRRDAPTGSGPGKYQRAEGWPASTTQAILDQMAADNAKERTAQKQAAHALNEQTLAKIRRTVARERRPKVARRSDGRLLSLEGNAAVLRDVFGDDPPTC